MRRCWYSKGLCGSFIVIEYFVLRLVWRVRGFTESCFGELSRLQLTALLILAIWMISDDVYRCVILHNVVDRDGCNSRLVGELPVFVMMIM